MKTKLIYILLLGILISGCIENPLKQVPVVKVNITLVEKEGLAVAENSSFTQGTVDYAGRPQSPVSTFPVISGRTMVTRKNSNASTLSTSEWESLPYKGNGTYTFNIGFNENYYPDPGDMVHVSVLIADEKGSRIGYTINNMIWE